MLHHSDEAAYNYIKAKKENPEGTLHLRYGARIRKAYKEGAAAPGGAK